MFRIGPIHIDHPVQCTYNYYVDSNSKILSLEVSIFSPDTTSGIKDNSMKLDQLYIRYCVFFEDNNMYHMYFRCPSPKYENVF